MKNLENDSAVNPKISARYQASDNLVLRASLSTSFREASLAQLTATTIGLQGIQDFVLMVLLLVVLHSLGLLKQIILI